MTRHLVWSMAIAALAGAAGLVEPAAARVRCIDGYQQNAGGEVRTPGCDDAYLAQIAREYGDHVSAAAIGNSYSLKTQVCRLVGNDIRVTEMCNQFRPSHHDGNHPTFRQQ